MHSTWNKVDMCQWCCGSRCLCCSCTFQRLYIVACSMYCTQLGHTVYLRCLELCSSGWYIRSSLHILYSVFHGIITYMSRSYHLSVLRCWCLFVIYVAGEFESEQPENACLHTAKQEPDAAGTCFWHPELDMLCMCWDILDLFPIKYSMITRQ